LHPQCSHLQVAMALSKIVSRSTGGQLDVILQRRVRPTSSHSPSLRPEHSTVSALVPRQSLSTAIRTSDLAHPQRPSSFVHVHSVLRHAPALSVPPHDPCPALWRCVQVVTSLRELSCYSENKARIVERGGLKVGDWRDGPSESLAAAAAAAALGCARCVTQAFGLFVVGVDQPRRLVRPRSTARRDCGIRAPCKREVSAHSIAALSGLLRAILQSYSGSPSATADVAACAARIERVQGLCVP
jgi:hypothetical protein